MSRTSRFLFLLCLCLPTFPSCRGTEPAVPTAHVGPVTAIVPAASGGAFSCSQAGVETPDKTWVRPSFRPTSIDVSADHLLVGGGDPAEQGDIALFTPTGSLVARKRIGQDLVYAVAIHPAQEYAAVGSADGSVQLVGLKKLSSRRQLVKHTAPCRAVCFSADGKLLATAGLDGLIYLYELDSGTRHTLKEHTAGVECLHFATTGNGTHNRLFSGARDGKVRIHDRASLVRTYQGLRQRVLGLATVKGTVLAGLSDGRIVRLNPKDATYEVADDIKQPLFSMAATNTGLVIGTAGRCVVGRPPTVK